MSNQHPGLWRPRRVRDYTMLLVTLSLAIWTLAGLILWAALHL